MVRKIYDFPEFKLKELIKEKTLKLYKSNFASLEQYREYKELKKAQIKKDVQKEKVIREKLENELEKYEVKEKEIKKEKSKFQDYETKNHKGYINSKSVNIFINDETTNKEHQENLKIINSVVNYYLIPFPHRQNYVKLHYVISIQGFQEDDITNEKSSINTHIVLDIDLLFSAVKEIYYQLVDLVQQGRSPESILIYKVDYINYDFRSYIASLKE